MSTQTATPPVPSRPRRRWTNEEFDRLVADGYIREGSRAYLWDGEIVEPMPENPPHVDAVHNLADLLRARLPGAEWIVYQGAPIVLEEHFKPQPDLMIVRGPRSAYRGRTPSPADVALLVEVSDSTYFDDAGEYLRAYARAGIPQYWLVNLPAPRVEVYSDPPAGAEEESSYRVREDHGLDGRVPLALTPDGVPHVPEGIDVRDVLRDSLS